MNARNFILNFLILASFTIGISLITKYAFDQGLFSTLLLSPENKAIHNFINLVDNNDLSGLSKYGAIETKNGLIFFKEEDSSLVAFAINNNLHQIHPTMDAYTYLQTLKEKGFLTINNQTLTFNPISLRVSTNLAETTITLNEIAYWESDYENLHTIIDDLPPFPIVIQGMPHYPAFLESEEKWIRPFQGNTNDRYLVEIQFKHRSILASSSTVNAILYVNDQATHFVLQPNAQEIGPLYLEFDFNALCAKKTYPWGDFESESISMPFAETDQTYHFHINPISNSLRETIYSTIRQFNNEYSEAFNHLNPNLLTVLTEKKLEYVRRQIKDKFIEQNLFVEMKLEYFSIIEDSFDFFEEKEEYTVTIDVQEQYWESKWYGRQNKPHLRKNKPQVLNYTLVYDPDLQQWLIDDWVTR